MAFSSLEEINEKKKFSLIKIIKRLVSGILNGEDFCEVRVD